jgi:hypothetical protein
MVVFKKLSTVIQFSKKYSAKGAASPELELRFSPWFMLFEYCKGGHEPNSSLCLYYVYLW